jgi:hypothetical protein
MKQLFRPMKDAIAKITPPLTVEKGRALLGGFGPDDCFGLAMDTSTSLRDGPRTSSERQAGA